MKVLSNHGGTVEIILPTRSNRPENLATNQAMDKKPRLIFQSFFSKRKGWRFFNFSFVYLLKRFFSRKEPGSTNLHLNRPYWITHFSYESRHLAGRTVCASKRIHHRSTQHATFQVWFLRHVHAHPHAHAQTPSCRSELFEPRDVIFNTVIICNLILCNKQTHSFLTSFQKIIEMAFANCCQPKLHGVHHNDVQNSVAGLLFWSY